MRQCLAFLLAVLATLAHQSPAQTREGVRSDLGTEEATAPETRYAAAFDRVWSEIDRRYSHFLLEPHVDWPALKAQYGPRAARATSRAEFLDVLKELLGHLHDLHVWIETPGRTIGTHTSRYTPNWNRAATLALLERQVDCGFAIVGTTHNDGFGYFLMVDQSGADGDGIRMAIDAIEDRYDAPGFVIDLRNANGGDERKASAIARLFCARKTVYARSKFRNGPAHDAFTRDLERTLPSWDRPFTKPVVCLIGPGAVSSGEGFVLMMRALPQVTTVGLPTRGASGNPAPFELADLQITVWFSRWVDMTPARKAFEGTGLAPVVVVDEPARAYDQADPTLVRGLEVLRRRIANAEGRAR